MCLGCVPEERHEELDEVHDTVVLGEGDLFEGKKGGQLDDHCDGDIQKDW